MNKRMSGLLSVIKRSTRVNHVRNTSNAAESTSSSPVNLDVEKCSFKKERFHKMQGYSISAYSNDLEELQFSTTLRKPYISAPNQVLVKVTAASVNPIDVAMMTGYGSTILNTMRYGGDIEFPLILGRDFAGVVVQKGMEIPDSKLKIGDKVFGVIPAHKQGCHADYVVADKCTIAKKPEILSDVDAACILYAGMTAWSGLFLSARLGGLAGVCGTSGAGKGKKVLVLGGAGGVGSMAIQILLAENARVHTTCAPDAIDSLQNLGVEKIFDYTSAENDIQLTLESPYDIILDCAGKGPEYAYSLPWKFQHYVTFSSPTLRNFDSSGLISGGIKNARDLFFNNVPALNQGGCVKWAYFIPLPTGIQYLKKLADQQKILPVMDSVFKYDKLFDAYQRVKGGHLRGKVAVDYSA